MKRNPRVVGEEGAEVVEMGAERTVAVLGRVAIVVGDVVVGNEREGIAGDVALHRRRSGSASK